VQPLGAAWSRVPHWHWGLGTEGLWLRQRQSESALDAFLVACSPVSHSAVMILQHTCHLMQESTWYILCIKS
jgi:hypothetical protein